MTSAATISFSALRVSRSGSPGPAPTSQTSPGRISSGSMERPPLLLQQPSDRGPARSAIGPRTEYRANLADSRQAAIGDGAEDGLRPHIEADANDRAFIGL